MRSQALILSPEHVHRVLEATPESFATASCEKQAALSHFEPKVALISHGPEWAARRRYNEAVLNSDRLMHLLAENFTQIVREEASRLRDGARLRQELIWDEFFAAWFRVVRRVIFGDAAAEDHELTDVLARLRSAANWAFLWPKRRRLQERFFNQLNNHLARATPGSLAGVMAATPVTEATAPSHQVPQWLFASDPAGMATFRALALLAAHPEHAAQAQQEIQSRDASTQPLPYLRATVLEALRLWPTTPLVLRESIGETPWEKGVMPAETGILIFAPFFQRDDQRLPYADHFSPELWLDEGTAGNWPLIAFSGGSGICPGRHLVLLLTSSMLAAQLEHRQVRLKPPHWLHAQRPLPGTLNNYALRFEFDG